MSAKIHKPANALNAYWEAEKILDLALDAKHRARETARAARRKVKAAKNDCKQAKQSLRAAEKQVVQARKAFRKATAKIRKPRRKRLFKASPVSAMLIATRSDATQTGTAQARRRDNTSGKTR